MISNKALAVAAGVAGWALTYVIAKSRKTELHRERRLQKKQITTWEGEGGNLPPQSSASPYLASHS